MGKLAMSVVEEDGADADIGRAAGTY